MARAISVSDVYDFLNTFAPVEMKMERDNIGFLVGCAGGDASRILLSLDITNDVVTEAIDTGAGLIVSHHPLFRSLTRVTDTDTTGKIIVRMLSGGISGICMHTNLDAARGGINDALAVAAGIADDTREAELLSDDNRLPTGEAFAYGRLGFLKQPCSLSEYLAMLKTSLGADGLRYYDAGKDVFKVAVVGGSGGSLFDDVIKSGCDTFLSADLKFHLFLEARERGINVIDGGHFCTENLIIGVLADMLREAFPDSEILISQKLDQTIKFF